MTTLDVSSDEDALLALVRGEAGCPFALTISSFGAAWTCTLTTEEGVSIGQGKAFRPAMLDLLGYAEKPKADRPKLKLVGRA